MRIRVLINWGAAGSLRRVLPGEYDINDPALMGMGLVIVAEGHAIVIEDAAPAVSDEDKTPKPLRRSKKS